VTGFDKIILAAAGRGEKREQPEDRSLTKFLTLRSGAQYMSPPGGVGYLGARSAFISFTFSTTIDPSQAAFEAICRIGSSSAR